MQTILQKQIEEDIKKSSNLVKINQQSYLIVSNKLENLLQNTINNAYKDSPQIDFKQVGYILNQLLIISTIKFSIDGQIENKQIF